MSGLAVTSLISGGLIVTYRCHCVCAHCLYRSGPRRDPAYMDPGTAGELAGTALALGCRGVHVGGGEPFLDPEALCRVLGAVTAEGLGIDYVETNAAWARDPGRTATCLEGVLAAGCRVLLVSMSPFHNACVPLSRTRVLLEAARKVGMSVLPWVAEFLPDLAGLDPARTHELAEYEDRFGPGYLAGVPDRYWIHPGGRAGGFLGTIRPRLTAGEVLAREPGTCATELSDTRHFHLDLNGQYVPGLCAGLAIRGDDLGAPLDPEVYPILTTLGEQGVAGLYEYATALEGFVPRTSGYVGKCDLCDDIRGHLVRNGWFASAELEPMEFYLPEDGEG